MDVRRMDTLPALEVVADSVEWNWEVGEDVNGGDTVVAGFSHVSIRTAHLLIRCNPDDTDSVQEETPTAAEALVGIVDYAPPTLQT